MRLAKPGDSRADLSEGLLGSPAPTVIRGSAAAAPAAFPVSISGSVAAKRTEPRDAFLLYLDEIGQTPLLTPAEELSVARRIRRGDKTARELMITANLRLVVKIARDYEPFGLPLLDLINEGNLGLIRAVEKFDPARGAKFSTYSSWWIKQSMRRALANQSKTIRLPIHMVDRIAKFRKVSVELEKQLGREATDEELSTELGMSLRRVKRLKTSILRPVALDGTMGEGDDRPIAEMVADDRVLNAFETLAAKGRLELLRDAVKILDMRELRIVSGRFGLDGNPERTLEEIGQEIGLTRERIRQVQNEALAKLRKLIEKREAICLPEAA